MLCLCAMYLIFQDMQDMNISIHYPPGIGDTWSHVMSQMPPPYPDLAERVYIASSWDEYWNITKYTLEKARFILIR